MILPSNKRLLSPKTGNATYKMSFFAYFLSKRRDIDYAENIKEQVRVLSNFFANPAFFLLATGANVLEIRDEQELTTKN